MFRPNDQTPLTLRNGAKRSVSIARSNLRALVATGTLPLHLMIAAAPFFAFPSFETLRFATLLRMRWKCSPIALHSPIGRMIYKLSDDDFA